MSPEHRSQWFLYGHYFGYPECCITSFCKLRHLDRQEGVQFEVAGNTGFIPCIRCAKRVKAGKVTLKGLISNRQSSRQFPTEDDTQDVEDMREWLKSLQVEEEAAE